MSVVGHEVESHYTRANLAESILEGARQAALDPQRLSPEQLGGVDEFHLRGREATAALARLADLRPGMEVLDIGCGIGGPARHLADSFGVRVTGIDLTSAYVDAALLLTERTGLTGRVSFQQADATAPPFPDARFDAIWTAHALMNVPDKRSVLREARRMLRPGGRAVHYEILQGSGGTPHYPVPWARDPAISFLVSPDEFRRLLEEEGLVIRTWQDVTAEAAEWLRNRPAPGPTPPPLGLHLLLGPDSRAMFANVLRNLDEQRIVVVMVVARRVQ